MQTVSSDTRRAPRQVADRRYAESTTPEFDPETSSGNPMFRQIVASMRNGVLAMAPDGTLAYMNAEAARIFGLPTRPPAPGSTIADLLAHHPDVVRTLLGARAQHQLPNRAELRLRPSGRVIGYTLSLLRDDHDRPAGVAMFFKDLTRVEQIEERERLRDRLAAVGEMAAAIAHEVRNPLAGIEVMAGLLRRKIPDTPVADALLTDIIAEAKMANAIVQDVLDFVRPIRLHMEHTAVVDAALAAIQLADTKARRGGIDVRLDVPSDLPPLQADRHQLTQLLTNLLINAYEAMDGHGRVTIAARPTRLDDGGDGRDAVCIEVADNGPGMPAEVAARVFDPFFTTKPQGSGLGLGIVRKIVDAHDGRIDLVTSAGHGTRLSLTLPVSSEHPQAD